MAANVISQLTTSNTFQQWLTTTQLLVGTTNLLTNGNGESFYANTNLIVGGSAANVSLNVETSATINILYANTVNTINLIAHNIEFTGNVDTLNVTNDAYIGKNLTVYEDADIRGNTTIQGDLVVTGNLILDDIGFDDLTVAGSGSFGNNLTVVGQTTLSEVEITGNVVTLNVTSQASFGTDVLISGDLTVSGNIILDDIGFNDLHVAGSADIANNLTVLGDTNLNTAVIASANVEVLVGAANNNIYAAIAAADASSLAYAIALG
jgi:hypothetical protein